MPPEVRRAISDCIMTAMLLGEEGRNARGFMLLREGAREAQRRTEVWAPEAVALWCAALQAFTERHPAEWYEFCEPVPA